MPDPVANIRSSPAALHMARLWWNRNQYLTLRYFGTTTGATEELWIDGVVNNRLQLPTDASFLITLSYTATNLTDDRNAGGITSVVCRNTGGTIVAASLVVANPMAVTGQATHNVTAPAFDILNNNQLRLRAGTAAKTIHWECIAQIACATVPESNMGSLT
jgi:hypothetical protein